MGEIAVSPALIGTRNRSGRSTMPASPAIISNVRWSLYFQAVALAIGGAWLLLRALLLESYSLVEFAAQSGVISLLAATTIVARLQVRVRCVPPSVRAEGFATRSSTDPTQLDDVLTPALSNSRWWHVRARLGAVLGIVGIACALWWITHVAHGLFLKRLWLGLDPFMRLDALLWGSCLMVAPAAPRHPPTLVGRRLRIICNVTILLILLCTYPYTDPFVRYVQLSGLFLPSVIMVAIWHLAAWLRGESFVQGWIEFVAQAVLPPDLICPSRAITRTSQIRVVGIGLVCVATVGLRLANITWGAPMMVVDREFRPYHPDEKHTYEQSWRMYFDPEPVTFAWGGVGYYRLGKLATEIATYLTEPHRVPRLQILLLRAVGIGAAVGIVLIVYRAGVLFFDSGTGLLAATLVATIPGNMLAAHVARPEAVFTLWCAAGLFAALKAIDSLAARQWLLLGGFFMGIATATKVTGVSLGAPLLMAATLAEPTTRSLLRRVGTIFLGACSGYFVTSFESLFFFRHFGAGIDLMLGCNGTQGVSGLWNNTMHYLGEVSAYAWTAPICILLLITAVTGVRRRHTLVLLVFVLAGYLISFPQRNPTIRSIVHLSPAVSLLVADLLSIGFRTTGSVWARWPIRILGAATLAYVVLESVGHTVYLRWGRDARTAASQWIETNVLADQTIGLTPLYYGEWASSPPLDEYRRAVVVLPIGEPYDASDYLDRDLDYILTCDLNNSAANVNATVASFLAKLESGAPYERVKTFTPSSCGVQLNQRFGWTMPYDVLYTRPTIHLFKRTRRVSQEF